MKLSADDRLDIQELYNKYNYTVDILRDANAMANYFVAEGATYDHGRYSIYSGRDEIRDFMQGAIDRQQGKWQHWNANLIIDASGDSVVATAHVLTIDSSSGQAQLAYNSLYRDQLEKTDNGWKFRSRRVGYALPEEG